MNRRDFLLSLSLAFLSGCGNSGLQGIAPAIIKPMIFVQSTPSGPYVFVGDSITAYWPLSRYWSNTINAGVPGQDTAAILARMDGLLATYPQAASFIILAGDNDSLDNNYAVAVQNITSMAQKCIAANIPFILCQVPARAWSMATLNESLITMCAANGYAYPVDYFSATSIAYDTQDTTLFVDSTHPNIAGYDMMAPQLAQRLPFNSAPYPIAAQVPQLLIG